MEENYRYFIGTKILAINIIDDDESTQIITNRGQFTISAAPIGYYNSYVYIHNVKRKTQIGNKGGGKCAKN